MTGLKYPYYPVSMKHTDKFKQFEDYVNVKVPKELKDKIKTAASKKGISIIEILKEKFKN